MKKTSKQKNININWNKLLWILNSIILIIGLILILAGFIYGDQVEMIMGESIGINLESMGYVGIGTTSISLVNLIICFFLGKSKK